jgi:hypothetical protein
MSTTTAVAMTAGEAREFRATWGAEAARLSGMSKAALDREEHRLMVAQGIQRIYGGPASRDEFITSVLSLRGYTGTRLNEATHVLCHADAVWPDCPWCTGGAA